MLRWYAKSRPFDVSVACGFIYSPEKYTNARGSYISPEEPFVAEIIGLDDQIDQF